MTSEREYTYWYFGLATGLVHAATSLMPLIKVAASGDSDAQQALVTILVSLRTNAESYKVPPMAARLNDALCAVLTAHSAAAQLPLAGLAGKATTGEAVVALDDVDAELEALRARLSELGPDER
jgi:hypothetical protein